MKKLYLILGLAVLSPIVDLAPVAHAQAVRTVVVGYGRDQYTAQQQAERAAKDAAGAKSYRRISQNSEYDYSRKVWVCSITIEI